MCFQVVVMFIDSFMSDVTDVTMVKSVQYDVRISNGYSMV